MHDIKRDSVDFPNPNEPVKDDRLYYRDDDLLRERALRGEGVSCRIFFGLRRYGKTSFLRHVERDCPGLAEPLHTLWLDGSGDPAKLRGEVSELIEQLVDDKFTSRGNVAGWRVLLDDIQELDKRLVRAETETARLEIKDNIERFAAKLAELLALSAEHDVKLILCEPTNLQEWLERESSVCAGPLFKSSLSDAAKPEPGNMLPPLDDGARSGNNQAYRLLTAMLDGKPRTHVDEKTAGDLCRHFGGNPWLLAHAHECIRSSGHTHWTTIITHVQERLMGSQDDVERIGTIYKSLSSTERFFVRMVYDSMTRGGESSRILANQGSAVWTTVGRAVALRMPETGLVDGKLGQGFSLTDVMVEYLSAFELRKYDLHKSTLLEDLQVWSELLLIPCPNSTRSTEFVIHQFSDLYLDNEWPDAWNNYVKYLRTLGGPTSDHVPDAIVISGNVLGFPTRKLVGEGRLVDYRRRLEIARDLIFKAIPHLRPLPSKPDAEPNQIIMVPGIFDLDWSLTLSETGRKRQGGDAWKVHYLKLWLEFFGETTHPGKVFKDDTRSVRIFPINTTSLETVAGFGGKAAQDLTLLRGILQERLYDDCSQIRYYMRDSIAQLDGERRRNARTAAARLLNETLNYVLEEEVGGTIGMMSEPTFRFLGIAKTNNATLDADQPHHIVADIGFVGESDKAALKCEAMEREVEMLRVTDQRRKSDRDPLKFGVEPVRLAVTHHLPHHRRQAGVVEIFDAVEFRQDLARAGINIVMHGHSDRQQMLTERVVFKSPSKDRRTRNASITLDLIGAMPCSRFIEAVADCVGVDGGGLLDGMPGFIEIKIAPNHTDPSAPRIISTVFNEVADNGEVTAIEGPSLSVGSSPPR